MSLPPLVRWRYDHTPEPGSREEALVRVLREPRAWV
jgi:coproporphyrinogen III oxidase